MSEEDSGSRSATHKFANFQSHLDKSRVPEWSDKYVRYRELEVCLRAIAKQGGKAFRASSVELNAVAVMGDQLDAARARMSRPMSMAPLIRVRGESKLDINSAVDMATLSEANYQKVDFLSLIANEASHNSSDDPEREFFTLLNRDFITVNSFFLTELDTFDKQFKTLKEQIPKLVITPSKTLQIRRAFEELYRGVDLLRNYRTLNYLAFSHAMKEHDRVSSLARKLKTEKAVMSVIDKSPFRVYNKLPIDVLFSKISKEYAISFMGGDEDKARQRLFGVTAKPSIWLMFRMGLSVGMFFAFLIVISILWVYATSFTQNAYFKAAFPVFRGVMLVTILIWCWGMCVFLYDKYRISYLFILQADPSSHLTFQQIWEVSSGLTIVVFVAVLLFGLSVWSQLGGPTFLIAPGVIHLVLFIVFWGMVFCPLNYFHRPTRKFFARVLVNVVITPVVKEGFNEFLMADILTSCVRVIFDMTYSMCFYFTGSFLDPARADTCKVTANNAMWAISFLPTYFRWIQCAQRVYNEGWYPHALNLLKYTLGLLISLFNLLYSRVNPDFFWPWVVVAVIGSTYSWIWDTIMDWGLGKRDSVHPYLRNNLSAPTYVYYGAIVANLLLRVAWVLSISPSVLGINPDWLAFLVAGAEIARRGMWMFFRMENEHFNNCGNYRVTHDIPTIAIKSADVAGEEALMGLRSPKSGERDHLHTLKASYNTDHLVACSTALSLVNNDQFQAAFQSKDWFAFANPFEESVEPVHLHTAADDKSRENSRVGADVQVTRDGSPKLGPIQPSADQKSMDNAKRTDTRPPIARLASHLVRANMTGVSSSTVTGYGDRRPSNAGNASPPTGPINFSPADLPAGSTPTLAEYLRVVDERNQLRQRLDFVHALITNPGRTNVLPSGVSAPTTNGTTNSTLLSGVAIGAGAATGPVASSTVSAAATGAIITGLSRRLAALSQTKGGGSTTAARIADVLREFQTIELLLAEAAADKSLAMPDRVAHNELLAIVRSILESYGEPTMMLPVSAPASTSAPAATSAAATSAAPAPASASSNESKSILSVDLSVHRPLFDLRTGASSPHHHLAPISETASPHVPHVRRTNTGTMDSAPTAAAASEPGSSSTVNPLTASQPVPSAFDAAAAPAASSPKGSAAATSTFGISASAADSVPPAAPAPADAAATATAAATTTTTAAVASSDNAETIIL